jgi:death-on-curing protein
MKWLNLQDLELIHMQIIDVSGGSHGTRDSGRLKSALASMQQSAFGQDLYPTVFDKAAVLARGVISDHPFIDGNKRTGMMSAIVFLNLNKVDTVGIKDKELEDFAVKIAVEKLDVKAISAWFKTNSKKA